MKKILIKIIILLIILFSITAFIKDDVARKILTEHLTKITGMTSSMEEMKISLLENWIAIKELVVINPIDFPDEIMIYIPELYIKYDLGDFIKGRIHVKELRIKLDELIIVKNKKRELNLNLLKIIQPSKVEDELGEKKEALEADKFKIDVLKLQVGKVSYKNYPEQLAPIIREFKIDIDERYEDISDSSALAGLILSKIFLSNLKVARLVAPDMGEVREEIAEAFKKAMELVPELGEEEKTTTEEIQEKTSEHPEKILPLGVK